MSKKSIIEREKKKNKVFFNYIKKKKSTTKKDKFYLQLLPKNSSITRIKRRCLITGRPKGVFRKFGICRCVLREKVLKGEIPGVYKLSW
ncbi:30S ribosomal protein S14 [Candidatus Vidania fulgoroideorum]